MHMQPDGVDWLPNVREYGRTKASDLDEAAREACKFSTLLASDSDLIQPVKMTLECCPYWLHRV